MKYEICRGTDLIFGFSELNNPLSIHVMASGQDWGSILHFKLVPHWRDV